MNTKSKVSILFTCLVLVVITQACLSGNEPLPPRNFTISDLLINQSQLPAEWKSKSGPSEEKCDSYNFSNCLQVSGIIYNGLVLNIEHIVGRFESVDIASRNYNNHSFTSDSDGISPTHWVLLDGFDYISPIANQFRVVCDTKWSGVYCVIEAQYEEYVSLLFFNGSIDHNQAISDLILLAKAIDAKMSQYLAKQ
jgi:hypothetical protein